MSRPWSSCFFLLLWLFAWDGLHSHKRGRWCFHVGMLRTKSERKRTLGPRTRISSINSINKYKWQYCFARVCWASVETKARPTLRMSLRHITQLASTLLYHFSILWNNFKMSNLDCLSCVQIINIKRNNQSVAERERAAYESARVVASLWLLVRSISASASVYYEHVVRTRPVCQRLLIHLSVEWYSATHPPNCNHHHNYVLLLISTPHSCPSQRAHTWFICFYMLKITQFYKIVYDWQAIWIIRAFVCWEGVSLTHVNRLSPSPSVSIDPYFSVHHNTRTSICSQTGRLCKWWVCL